MPINSNIPLVARTNAKGKLVRARVNVKVPELVAVPPEVVTLILPVAAPEGTVAVIWVEETTT